MPIGDLRDGFFSPTLTLKMNSYIAISILSCIIGAILSVNAIEHIIWFKAFDSHTKVSDISVATEFGVTLHLHLQWTTTAVSTERV